MTIFSGSKTAIILYDEIMWSWIIYIDATFLKSGLKRLVHKNQEDLDE